MPPPWTTQGSLMGEPVADRRASISFSSAPIVSRGTGGFGTRHDAGWLGRNGCGGRLFHAPYLGAGRYEGDSGQQKCQSHFNPPWLDASVTYAPLAISAL